MAKMNQKKKRNKKRIKDARKSRNNVLIAEFEDMVRNVTCAQDLDEIWLFAMEHKDLLDEFNDKMTSYSLNLRIKYGKEIVLEIAYASYICAVLNNDEKERAEMFKYTKAFFKYLGMDDMCEFVDFRRELDVIHSKGTKITVITDDAETTV